MVQRGKKLKRSAVDAASLEEEDSDDDIGEIIKRRRLQKKQQAAQLPPPPPPMSFAAMKESMGPSLNISNVTDGPLPRTQAEKDAEARQFKDEIDSIAITEDFSECPQERMKPFKFQLAPEHFLLW